MDRYLSPTLFAADFSGNESLTRTCYKLKSAKEVGFKEEWLKRAIAANPELVMAACREADLTDEAWMVWAEELSLETAGTIDVLLVSDSGRIAIVETKLSYNPEGRRSVVAQTLEYAIHLSEIAELPGPDLPPLPKLEGREFIDLETIRGRIREGDYLLIVAGDRLDSRAVRLSKTMLGRHLVQSWELALVDVSVFECQLPGNPPQYLLVPHLRGAIVAEQRQVVRIVVEGNRAQVHVEPQAAVSHGSSRQRQDEESFSHALPVEQRQFFDRLRALRERYSSFSWSPASASIVFRNRGFNILELYSSGEVRFRPGFFVKALGKLPASRYHDQLRKLFPAAIESYSYAHLNPVNSKQLLKLLEEVLGTASVGG